jgi:hypothetical protein
VIVGDDRVPLGIGERFFHRFGGVHSLVVRLVAAALQFAQEEQGIVFGVLHDQHPQRRERFPAFR